jgi:hypothetical protein
MTFVSTISAFDGLIAVYVGLPCELSKPKFVFKQLISVHCTHVRTNNIISWQLPSVLPSLFSHFSIHTGLQRYHDISFTGSGVNQLWIFEKSQNNLLKIESSRSS